MNSMDENTPQKPTKAALRAALSIAEPPDDDPFDLGLERMPPRYVNGHIIPSKPRATLRNLDRILRGDPVFAGSIRWNDMAAHIEWDGRPIEDYRVTELALAIAERHEVEFAMSDLHGMVELVAREHSYHPVREWLDGLTWVVTTRLERMGIDLDLVRAEHEQVWAEAVAAYRAGERWHLSRELDGARHEANAAYRREDPLTQSLATVAEGQGFFTVGEFWEHLELPLTQLTAAVVSRIGLIMAEIDSHEHVQVRRGGARVRGYRRKERPVTPKGV